VTITKHTYGLRLD